jgi:hypothetical protein
VAGDRDSIPTHPCVEHFRKWLVSLGTGCHFAGMLAAQAKLNFYAVSSFAKSDLPHIDGLIASSALDARAFVILFPQLRSAAGLVQMLDVLHGAERWTVERVPWRKHERRGAVLIGVQWSNDAGNRMSVMGFAPLMTMPATRRPPYAALAIWGGGHENDARNRQRAPRGKVVGIVDVPTGLSDSGHAALRDTSIADVGHLLTDPPEDGEQLRKVAFCVPRSVVGQRWKLPRATSS